MIFFFVVFYYDGVNSSDLTNAKKSSAHYIFLIIFELILVIAFTFFG